MIEAPSLPFVVQAGAPDCTVMSTKNISTAPGSCGGVAAMAVEVRYPYDGSVWLVMLCAHHGAQVPDAEPLTAAQAAHNQWRRDQRDNALNARPWEPTAPLRTGRRPQTKR